MKWSKEKKPITRQTTYQAILDSKIERKYRYSFRASSLPICQVKYFWSELAKHPITHDSLHKSFYCDVGTTIHSVLQLHLSRLGLLFGNWKCTVCKKYLEHRLSPLYCCGELMEYVELEFKNKYLTGHCDGITIYQNKKNGIDVYLNEFKSFGEQSLTKPYEGHMEQLNTYYNMLLKYIKKNDVGFSEKDIRGLWFWYVSRKNPSKHKEFFIKPNKVKSRKRYLANITAIKEAKRALKNKDVNGIKMKCKTRGDARNIDGTYCEWVDKCFGPGDWKLEMKGLLQK